MTTQAVPIHGPREKMSKFKVNAYTTNQSVCTHLILSLVTNVLSFEKAFSMLKMYSFPDSAVRKVNVFQKLQMCDK